MLKSTINVLKEVKFIINIIVKHYEFLESINNNYILFFI